MDSKIESDKNLVVLKDYYAKNVRNMHYDTTLHKADNTINSKVAIWGPKADITKLKIDCIVTASNEKLGGCFTPGHCIDAAIHLAAGPELIKACKQIGGCSTGEAKITLGYNLPSKYIIHTTGPQIKKGTRITQINVVELSKCYTSTLELAKLNKIKSIAFCCISTGVFGFDKHLACGIALGTVREWLEKNKDSIDLVVFDIWTEEDYKLYMNYCGKYFPDQNYLVLL